MDSFRWKCKYCGNAFRVAAIMKGRRVRCPSCASFSKAVGRFRRDKSEPKRPNFIKRNESKADFISPPNPDRETTDQD